MISPTNSSKIPTWTTPQPLASPKNEHSLKRKQDITAAFRAKAVSLTQNAVITPLKQKFSQLFLTITVPRVDSSMGCMKKVALRVEALFRALLFIIVGLALLTAGIAIAWIPPAQKLGFELCKNGIFALKLTKDIACESFNPNLIFNSFQLLKGEGGTYQSEFSWHLNLGLLRNACDKTNDPALKQQIKFLAANYIGKAAPYHTEKFRFFDPRFDLVSQINPFAGSSYHRWSCIDDIAHTAKFNKDLALGDECPLILTDTVEITETLALKYSLIQPQGDWVVKIKSALDVHLAKQNDPSAIFDKSLDILFDITSLLENCMNDMSKKTEALGILKKFRRELDQAIDKVVSGYPQLNRKKLKTHILNGTTCISRVKLGPIAGIKLLPLNEKVTGKNLLEEQSDFFKFIDATGLYINRVTLYRNSHNDHVFTKNTQYAVNGPQNVAYFKNIDDLSRNFQPFSISENPYVRILGNATLKLLDGWVKEIGQTRWEKINQDLVVREILDATLYKIKIQFANAQEKKTTTHNSPKQLN